MEPRVIDCSSMPTPLEGSRGLVSPRDTRARHDVIRRINAVIDSLSQKNVEILIQDDWYTVLPLTSLKKLEESIILLQDKSKKVPPVVSFILTPAKNGEFIISSDLESEDILDNEARTSSIQSSPVMAETDKRTAVDVVTGKPAPTSKSVRWADITDEEEALGLLEDRSQKYMDFMVSLQYSSGRESNTVNYHPDLTSWLMWPDLSRILEKEGRKLVPIGKEGTIPQNIQTIFSDHPERERAIAAVEKGADASQKKNAMCNLQALLKSLIIPPSVSEVNRLDPGKLGFCTAGAYIAVAYYESKGLAKSKLIKMFRSDSYSSACKNSIKSLFPLSPEIGEQLFDAIALALRSRARRIVRTDTGFQNLLDALILKPQDSINLFCKKREVTKVTPGKGNSPPTRQTVTEVIRPRIPSERVPLSVAEKAAVHKLNTEFADKLNVVIPRFELEKPDKNGKLTRVFSDPVSYAETIKDTVNCWSQTLGPIFKLLADRKEAVRKLAVKIASAKAAERSRDRGQARKGPVNPASQITASDWIEATDEFQKSLDSSNGEDKFLSAVLICFPSIRKKIAIDGLNPSLALELIYQQFTYKAEPFMDLHQARLLNE